MLLTRRRVLTAAGIGMALLAGQAVPQVHAECVSVPPCEEFAKASIVVLADVIQATSGLEVIGNTASMVPQVVRLRNIERFKGIPEDQREITAGIDTQGEARAIKLGRHLIYAHAFEIDGPGT